MIVRHLDKFGFGFSVLGALATNFIYIGPLALVLVGVCYLIANVCWYKYAKGKGESYLCYQQIAFSITSIIMIFNGLSKQPQIMALL